VESKKQPLDTRPARSDMTDRECAKLIGACLGWLVEMADVETVKRAVVWWAETDAAWDDLRLLKEHMAAAVAAAARGSAAKG
jgi:hypothetical protein